MESVKISPKKCKIAMALAGHHTALYNGHLYTMATFFCLQGGHCREVQL